MRPGLHGRTRAAAQSLNGNGAAIHEAMMRWLGDAGLPEQAVELCDETGLAHRGYPMGMTVAARDVKPGDVLLSVPLSLCITLDR